MPPSSLDQSFLILYDSVNNTKPWIKVRLAVTRSAQYQMSPSLKSLILGEKGFHEASGIALDER